MVIAGGRPTAAYRNSGSNEYVKTFDVVFSDGHTCAESNQGIPELPEFLEGFGMASKKDRFIYLCGGIDRTKHGGHCWRHCGKFEKDPICRHGEPKTSNPGPGGNNETFLY